MREKTREMVRTAAIVISCFLFMAGLVLLPVYIARGEVAKDILDQSRFTIHNNGAVTDHGTGLMWVADMEDAGLDFEVSWAAARDYIRRLDYAGYSDWRMPTIKELVSIIDYGTFNPATFTGYITLRDAEGYWSVSLVAAEGGRAWGVWSGNGFVSNEDLSLEYYFIAVRDKLQGDRD